MTDGKDTAAKTKPLISKENAQNRPETIQRETVLGVNHQMKTETDNPTLGLLICKDMDKVEAQYALESTIVYLPLKKLRLN